MHKFCQGRERKPSVGEEPGWKSLQSPLIKSHLRELVLDERM